MFILSIVVGLKYSQVSYFRFYWSNFKVIQVLKATNSINKIVNSHVHLSKLTALLKNRNDINKENFEMDYKEGEPAVVFENVNFRYFNSDIYIFKNLSFELSKNKHTVLTGANGSGKSTLLGLLAGVYYAETGKVRANCRKFGYIGATH